MPRPFVLLLSHGKQQVKQSFGMSFPSWRQLLLTAKDNLGIKPDDVVAIEYNGAGASDKTNTYRIHDPDELCCFEETVKKYHILNSGDPSPYSVRFIGAEPVEEPSRPAANPITPPGFQKHKHTAQKQKQEENGIVDIKVGVKPVYRALSLPSSPAPSLSVVLEAVRKTLQLSASSSAELRLREKDDELVVVGTQAEWSRIGWPRARQVFREGKEAVGWQAATFEVVVSSMPSHGAIKETASVWPASAGKGRGLGRV
ncbi:hypothetical protein JCM10213_008911 [Rhodosporidiobolus nylandii]